MEVWNRHIKCLQGVIITFILLFNTYYCPGQLLSNQGQIIYISPNTLMSIEGTVLNNGSLSNNGEIVVTGDWENGGEYIAGNGALVFSGKDQLINHNNANIYELVIEGGGKKKFTTDANILGKFYLINGIVTPDNQVKLLAKQGTSIEGGNAKSYINGPFYHEGFGRKVFPIGKNTHYSPIELHLYGNPVVGFEVFEPNPASYFSLEFQAVSKLKYWRQYWVSGQIENASTITLPMTIEGESVNPEQLAIAGASIDDGNYRLLETLDYSGTVNNGVITSALNPAYDLFALGILAESPEERALYIPNAFAPHSPAANWEDSRIKVYGKEISNEAFLFRIYNRWGVLVYETTSYEEAKTTGWDGINRNTGQPEMIGSYKYIVKGKFNSGKAIEKTGNIHLIR